MAKKDKRIDDYISKSADFAKPILKHFRELVHKTCPDAEEAWKWSFPHFDYLGGPMCSMAAFKQHCAITFWKASLMKDKKLVETAKTESAMGHLGRITSLKDLPKDTVLVRYIREAMKLNEEGIKVSTKAKTTKKDLEIPAWFMKALKRSKEAMKTFEGFSYTNKKEYLEWVTGAKTDETREKRLETAVEWMAEGKVRNWKYLKK